jgi:hypothetical protein
MRPSRRVAIDVIVTSLIATILAIAVLRLLLSGMCCQ